MPTVAVDIEDLERLVFATSVLKTIEGALASYKEDPFVKPHLDFTSAHNRLASVVRNFHRSARQDTLIKFDAPLEPDEIAMLRELDSTEQDTPWRLLSVKDKLPKRGEEMSVFDRLAAKGCIVMGNFMKGVRWADDPKPQLQADPSGFAIKLTDRGRQKLLAAPDESTNRT